MDALQQSAQLSSMNRKWELGATEGKQCPEKVGADEMGQQVGGSHSRQKLKEEQCGSDDKLGNTVDCRRHLWTTC